MAPYTTHLHLPEPATYQQLRVRAGLSPKAEPAVARALANSLFAVVVKQVDQPVGMGRVIGDGGCFCQVVDICVLPEHQGKGVGKLLMQAIHQYLLTLPESCYVSLLADGNADKLYEQFGF